MGNKLSPEQKPVDVIAGCLRILTEVGTTVSERFDTYVESSLRTMSQQSAAVAALLRYLDEQQALTAKVAFNRLLWFGAGFLAALVILAFAALIAVAVQR